MMWPNLTNVVAQAYMMEPEACKCRLAAIDSTKRHIRRGIGVLNGYYAYIEGAPKISGKIQGYGAVGAVVQ